MVHTMKVSTKTSKEPQSPCSTGCLVLLEACTMGLVPQPASLEYTLLCMPVAMALDTVTPANPPMAAVPVKALVKMEAMVGTRFPIRMMIKTPNSI